MNWVGEQDRMNDEKPFFAFVVVLVLSTCLHKIDLDHCGATRADLEQSGTNWPEGRPGASWPEGRPGAIRNELARGPTWSDGARGLER